MTESRFYIFPIFPDLHRVRPLLNQALGRQDMFNFAGANAERESSESPVCGGMGVPTDNGHPREGQALLRPNNVDDPLSGVLHIEQCDLELLTVLFQGLDLSQTQRIRNLKPPVCGRHVMVRDRQGCRRPPRSPPRLFSKPFKGLWRGDFMEEVTVDVEKSRSSCSFPGRHDHPRFFQTRFCLA